MRLADEQLPLIMADTFTGEPGFSAPVYEVDFAPRKQRCDVLLVGSAHAPAGPARSTRVRGRACASDRWTKTFDGGRQPRLAGRRSPASAHRAPEPFTEMPISYDVAFGGADQQHEDPAKHAAFMPQPGRAAACTST